MGVFFPVKKASKLVLFGGGGPPVGVGVGSGGGAGADVGVFVGKDKGSDKEKGSDKGSAWSSSFESMPTRARGRVGPGVVGEVGWGEVGLGLD